MKAHRTDVVSFAFGLVFLGLALWWLLARILGLAVPPVGWFLAGGLVLIGLLGLVGALRSGRGPDRADQSDQAGPAEGPETTVAAPYRDGVPAGGRAVPAEADEWPTDATTAVPTPASEDRPADPEPPAWGDRPADPEPLRSPAEPATEELGTGGPAGRAEPATRELPPLDPGDDDGSRAGRAG
ncbi:hypothetical protein CO540_23695 [Micromonospora sp. WMMA2032]|nr:hypothetical protein [Micromonospora sp. WMMA2032]ATO16475.1 hypothetical protein CO540_23695 [Micromonospora sp. WMMA2032]